VFQNVQRPILEPLPLIKIKIMKKMIFTLLPIIILSCGIKNVGVLSENEKEIIKSELQSIMNQIVQNNENGNMEKAIEPYLNSPEFISISNGQVSDYIKFMTENTYYFDALKSQKFSDSELIYTYINNENVIITWSSSAFVQMKDEQEIKIDPYTVTFMFKKVNELWKVTYAHGSGIIVPIIKDSTLTK
jgi:hypothetical protein